MDSRKDMVFGNQRSELGFGKVQFGTKISYVFIVNFKRSGLAFVGTKQLSSAAVHLNWLSCIDVSRYPSHMTARSKITEYLKGSDAWLSCTQTERYGQDPRVACFLSCDVSVVLRVFSTRTSKRVKPKFILPHTNGIYPSLRATPPRPSN